MAKITLSTIKSFIKNNRHKLYINVVTNFDSSQDCTVAINTGFNKAVDEPEQWKHSSTLGISGAWFVGRSRDYFSEYNENGMKGYKIYNSCGSFILAVPA